MLEWYRAHAPYQALMQDCAELLAVAAEAAGAASTAVSRPELRSAGGAGAGDRGRGVRASSPASTCWARSTPPAPPTARRWRRRVRAAGVRVAADDSWSDLFSRVLVEKIEPRLGLGRATILCEYPVAEAALARPKPGDPRVAERFELYACGVELANGFGELTDPVEQRRRFEAEMALKQQVYGERYPLDEDFLAALALMPPASGIALGFDRLVMLATGAPTIEHVLWAPVPAQRQRVARLTASAKRARQAAGIRAARLEHRSPLLGPRQRDADARLPPGRHSRTRSARRTPAGRWCGRSRRPGTGRSSCSGRGRHRPTAWRPGPPARRWRPRPRPCAGRCLRAAPGTDRPGSCPPTCRSTRRRHCGPSAGRRGPTAPARRRARARSPAVRRRRRARARSANSPSRPAHSTAAPAS